MRRFDFVPRSLEERLSGTVPADGHVVQFYDDDAFLADAVARFLGSGIGAGDAAVVIATPEHREGIDRHLGVLGFDVAALRGSGRYVALDAQETLAALLVDGVPDGARFAEVVETVVASAAARVNGRVRAFGEMVVLLWREARRDAALTLECLWNAAARQPLSLLCAYPLGGFALEGDAKGMRDVCAEHADVVPAEDYTVLATDADRRRAIVLLQQKAHALENEIERRRGTERALERARTDAEAANRAKDEFLAMLGHELRNPLSAVRNAVITARLDPSRRDRALDVARRGADQLGRLVDDLLDVARITQGRITLRRQRLPFAGIVERAIEADRPLLEERAQAVTLVLPAPDVQVDGDTTRLEQVVANLLTNAAKYSDPGGRITVTAAREGGEVVLCVRDEGIGIAPDMLPRVFDLFAQSDRSLDRAQGGLGIGLTVVKRLVELHGGRVEARSQGLGFGSEFVVWLPVVVPVGDPTAASTESRDRRQFARVLLVEDNADVAESLMMLLELLGHRVRIACDGPSALEAAQASVPDVMLVDIGLPGMNGYEVARRVRHDVRLQRVVLVALTGYGREEDREQALAAGFDHHLVKPVNPDALEGLVAGLPSVAATRPDRVVH